MSKPSPRRPMHRWDEMSKATMRRDVQYTVETRRPIHRRDIKSQWPSRLSDQCTRLIRRDGRRAGQMTRAFFREDCFTELRIPSGTDNPTLGNLTSNYSPKSLFCRDGKLPSGSDDPTWHLWSVGLIGRSNDHGRYFGIQNWLLHRMIWRKTQNTSD